MAGLVPAIHDCAAARKTWAAGPSPVMTEKVNLSVGWYNGFQGLTALGGSRAKPGWGAGQRPAQRSVQEMHGSTEAWTIDRSASGRPVIIAWMAGMLTKEGVRILTRAGPLPPSDAT